MQFAGKVDGAAGHHLGYFGDRGDLQMPKVTTRKSVQCDTLWKIVGIYF